MTRNIPAALATEISGKHVRPIMLGSMETLAGTLRLWTGTGSLVWNGDTYIGTGYLLTVSPIEESNDLKANGLKFQLTGLPSALLSVSLSNARINMPVRIYIAALTDAGALVADPYLLFEGKSDQIEINETGETTTITVSVENNLVDLKRAKARRYTPEDQKRRDPDDRGFDFVASLQEKEIFWGRANPPPPRFS